MYYKITKSREIVPQYFTTVISTLTLVTLLDVLQISKTELVMCLQIIIVYTQ